MYGGPRRKLTLKLNAISYPLQKQDNLLRKVNLQEIPKHRSILQNRQGLIGSLTLSAFATRLSQPRNPSQKSPDMMMREITKPDSHGNSMPAYSKAAQTMIVAVSSIPAPTKSTLFKPLK